MDVLNQLVYEGATIRPQLLSFPFSLLLATGASAQVQQPTVWNPQSPVTVEITAKEQPFRFYHWQAEWISGGYQLSNGSRLKVEATSDGIDARIDKQRVVRLVAVSRDRYVSRDGNMTIEFNRNVPRQE